VPQKTPLAQSMLDDMYRIHALLKGNDTSDLSNADSIKSGTTRCVRKNSDNTKTLVDPETCTSSPYPGVTSFPPGNLPRDVDEHRGQKDGDADHLLQRRWSQLRRSSRGHRRGARDLGKALTPDKAL
jgi:hypothetical protein